MLGPICVLAGCTRRACRHRPRSSTSSSRLSDDDRVHQTHCPSRSNIWDLQTWNGPTGGVRPVRRLHHIRQPTGRYYSKVAAPLCGPLPCRRARSWYTGVAQFHPRRRLACQRLCRTFCCRHSRPQIRPFTEVLTYRALLELFLESRELLMCHS
jgi:hypothetical protein